MDYLSTPIPPTDDSIAVPADDGADLPVISGGDSDPRKAQPDSDKPMRPKRTDVHIWGIYLFLVLISLFELYSASIQEVTAADVSGPLIRHGRFLLVGLGLMLALQYVHYKWIYYFIPLYVVGTICVMILVLFVGTNINGALRGLRIGPIFLLPAEMLKLAVALGIAWIATRFQIKGTHDITTTGLWICGGFVALCCGLLFFHGLTNTLLVAVISITMMALGFGGRKFWTFLLVFGALGGLVLGVRMLSKSDKPMTERQMKIAKLNKEDVVELQGQGRAKTWNSRLAGHFRLDKYNDTITDANKQEQISYIAQAHGGLRGVGIGKSRENSRLPLAYSDYIYAIVVEELGLFVAIFVLALYIWLLMHAGRLATRFKSTLPSLLVIGCAIVVVYQALFHMAIVTGVFPVSGQPLPLLSKGGTSVIVTSLALGVMLSVSRHAARNSDSEEIVALENKELPDQLRKDNPVELS